jgi:hypothetical protein
MSNKKKKINLKFNNSQTELATKLKVKMIYKNRKKGINTIQREHMTKQSSFIHKQLRLIIKIQYFIQIVKFNRNK